MVVTEFVEVVIGTLMSDFNSSDLDSAPVKAASLVVEGGGTC